MTHCGCVDLTGTKIVREFIYVKNKNSPMNPDGYTMIGVICPICHTVELKFKGEKGIGSN